ncbi:MAG: hypothetical protein PT119_11345 [Aphanizomenon gracile PMC627.10]|nr:hypothetical protein [Aphanizomenon gracile PMC627.10]
MTFGIVTACHKADYFMVKATCASIRRFLPDIPICVIIDGDFSVAELQKLYNVQTLYTSEFKNQTLRIICPGSPRAKLAAIWESPFEQFLCVDSDIIFWGDVLSKIDLNNYDFISLTNWKSSLSDKKNIEHYLFNTDEISEIDPDFNWLDRPFFCAGAFACKKNCLNVDEYIALEEFSKKHPGVFSFAEQGIFNYMVMKAWDKGNIELTSSDLQYIVGDHSHELTKQKFITPFFNPPEKTTNPTLVHFCGVKPLLQNINSYSYAFTVFRLFHYRNLYGNNLYGNILSIIKIILEEIEIFKNKFVSRIRKIMV